LKSGNSILQFFRRAFVNPTKRNWKIVILCFVGASTFWFFNSLNKNYTTKINYPVQFDFDRDSVVILKELPAKIRIDVSSVGWNIFRKNLGINVEPVVVPLKNPTETSFMTGNYLLPIISDQIEELEVNYVAEDSVFFSIDKLVSKQVFLRIEPGNIAMEENHRITSEVKIDPDTILVFGPKSVLDSLGGVQWIDVLESGIEEDFSEPVTIGFLENRFLSSPITETNVSFEVSKFIRYVQSVPVEPRNFPEDRNIQLEPERIVLDFTIEESLVPQIADSLFLVTCDYKNVNPYDSTVIPRVVSHPDFIENISFVNSQLKVRFE
jgi:YbbR domain-containing protein